MIVRKRPSFSRSWKPCTGSGHQPTIQSDRHTFSNCQSALRSWSSTLHDQATWGWSRLIILSQASKSDLCQVSRKTTGSTTRPASVRLCSRPVCLSVIGLCHDITAFPFILGRFSPYGLLNRRFRKSRFFAIGQMRSAILRPLISCVLNLGAITTL